MDFNDAEFALALKEDQERVPEVEEIEQVETTVKEVWEDDSDDDHDGDQPPTDGTNAEATAASTSAATGSNPSQVLDEDVIMIEDDDGDPSWEDEEGDDDEDEDEDGEGDEDEDDDEEEDESDDEPEVRNEKDAIWGFGSLRMANNANRAQCTRQQIAFHASYVSEPLVFKDRVETKLPFRWSFKDADVIKLFDRVMIDDEHIIGQRVSGRGRHRLRRGALTLSSLSQRARNEDDEWVMSLDVLTI